MATLNKFNVLTADMASGAHNFATGTPQTFKIALSNTLPLATNAVLSDITEISATNGYTAGGNSIGTVTGSQTSGVFKFIGGSDPSWTASTGSMVFRYPVLYNSTNNKLIGWIDYGAVITLTIGNTFIVDLDQVNGIFTVT